MLRNLDCPHLSGAGAIRAPRNTKTAPEPCDIAALRPITAILGARDYWALSEHRRRCEELGGERFLRLARLIRAKLADAHFLNGDATIRDVVTGTSRVTFVINGRRPQTCLLYHWDRPGREHPSMPVATVLGVTLIGMSVGERVQLLGDKGYASEVQILAVHAKCASGPFRPH